MIDFILIFIAFGAVFTIIYFFFLDEEVDSVIQSRLDSLKSGKLGVSREGAEAIYNALEKREHKKKLNVIEMLKDNSEYRLPGMAVFLNQFQFTHTIKGMLKKADIKMPIDVFFMAQGALFVPFLLISMLKNNFLFLVIGLVAAIAPLFFLKNKYKSRLNAFSKMFPDALGVISNSLRAGHSLLAAFQMVPTESGYPINKLFKNISDEIALGREVREALEDLKNQIPDSQDLKFFTTAVLIQKEVGGNLAEILDTLSKTIREREKLLGLIKTQTAQAQLSGIVLGLAPVFISGMVSLLNPEYMKPLFETFLGNCCLGASIFLSVAGYLIIQQITKIRV